jgi:hypothetical protein
MGACSGSCASTPWVRVVVGLPLGLSGRDTAQTEEARAFAARLAERLGDRVPGRAVRRALHDAHRAAVGRLLDGEDSRAAAACCWRTGSPPGAARSSLAVWACTSAANAASSVDPSGGCRS